MIERGDATAEDIDTAMELGAGYRKSTFITRTRLTSSDGCKSHILMRRGISANQQPFKLLDFVGLGKLFQLLRKAKLMIRYHLIHLPRMAGKSQTGSDL
jgi:hypothetical protein